MAPKAWYVLTHESRSEMDADTTSALDYEHAQRLMMPTEMRDGGVGLFRKIPVVARKQRHFSTHIR
jgi:hypothetical protein